MAEKRELIKVVCRAVVLVKDGDTILREEISDERNCYNPDDMFKFWNEVQENVKAMNPNRSQKRQQPK